MRGDCPPRSTGERRSGSELMMTYRLKDRRSAISVLHRSVLGERGRWHRRSRKAAILFVAQVCPSLFGLQQLYEFRSSCRYGEREVRVCHKLKRLCDYKIVVNIRSFSSLFLLLCSITLCGSLPSIHRAISHSLPSQLLWPFLSSPPLSLRSTPLVPLLKL